MGKHRGNPSSEQSVRARTIAVRCFSGGVCLSLAVLTFGIHGLAGTAVREAPSRLTAAGAVGPEALDTEPQATAAAPITEAAAAPITEAAAAPELIADALAPVAFSRSNVETTSKEGVGQLNVAVTGLKRPPLGSLMAPLESLHSSSSFGLRTSPLTGTAGEFHWGQDYAAPCGTRVYAADAGVVRAVGWHPWGGGNRAEVDHGNGLITTYNHLQEIAVKKGDSVQVGEVIAKVGTTGSSTGCHLHFETILNGSHANPLRWTLIPVRQVDSLGPIVMTSYAPDAEKTSNATLGWAVPARTDDHKHVVAGGVQERSVATIAAASPPASVAAAKPGTQSKSASPSTSESPSPSKSASPSPSLSTSKSSSPSTSKSPAPSPSKSASPSKAPSPAATKKAETKSSPKDSASGTPKPARSAAEPKRSSKPPTTSAPKR